jgi:aspartokinase-like uncharacterized kinase
MNEKQVLKRKIFLKAQAVKGIRAERQGLKRRLSLLELKEYFENQIIDKFDPRLSAKLDCVIYLLEADEVRNGK